MITEALVEGRGSKPLELSIGQVDQLQRLGRAFATSSPTKGQDEDPSAIRVERLGASTWSVTVSNAVGVVAVDDLRLVVNPKIPLAHLVHLFIRSGRLPVSAATATTVDSADLFWPMVARWLIDELDRLLRAGLLRGYQAAIEDLPFARGHILQIPTSIQLLRGQPRFLCEFEQFEADTALNRVLLAAAQIVALSSDVDAALRKRARVASLQMLGIGPLRHGDIDVQPLSSERSYGAVSELAKHVIRSVGRAVAAGASRSRSFLLRTPEPVEEALRAIAREALVDVTEVIKRTLPLVGAAESLNPDLVFGTAAVGDVKYKVWDDVWPRADLYQLVAFATGFRVSQALRTGFAPNDTSQSRVRVGNVTLQRCDWTCGDDVCPTDAETSFKRRLREWWSTTGHGTESSGLAS